MSEPPKPRAGCYWVVFILLVIAIAIGIDYFYSERFFELLQYLSETSQTGWENLTIDVNTLIEIVDEPHSWYVYIGVGVGYVFILYAFVARLVPPIRSRSEFWQSFMVLLFRWSRFVQVREGSCTPPLEDIRNQPQNIAIVDLSSALVLDRRIWTPHPQEFDDGIGLFAIQPPYIRVAGPGLVFFQRGERIHSAVSLQRQIRILKETRAITADGIEVQADIYLLFSISQPPDVIKVTSVGEGPDNLRVVNIDEDTLQISSIVDELDDADRREIFEFLGELRHQEGGNESGNSDSGTGGQNEHEDSERAEIGNAQLLPELQGMERPPYTVDEERIFRAVFSRADQENSEEFVEWTDLPVQVAVEIFKHVISRWTFDAMFEVQNPEVFPLQDEIIPRYRARVRHQGILAYQYIHRGAINDATNNGVPAIGDRVDIANGYQIFDRVEFRASRPLRNAGIKVILCGFTGFRPTNIEVINQRLESWQAAWQREANMVYAGYDREATIIRGRAREEAQRELINSLSELFSSPTESNEALALRFFQSLESLAADPATRRYLSLYTLQLLRSLGDQLGLPDNYPVLPFWFY